MKNKTRPAASESEDDSFEMSDLEGKEAAGTSIKRTKKAEQKTEKKQEKAVKVQPVSVHTQGKLLVILDQA